MARPTSTNYVTDLQMAKLAFVEELSYSAIAVKLGLGTKNTVYLRLKKLKEEFPDFINYLQTMKSYTPEEQLEVEEGTVTLSEDMKKKSIADKIEEQIRHLLDVSPEQIRSMKTEHRLKHVETLTKTMRLLREESTENVKQVSLIKCIGIATERRKPTQ